jgi:hypothetical protein
MPRVENDGAGIVYQKEFVTKPGQDYPREPRVDKVFKDEDEMDDRMRGLKKRKRAKERKNKLTNIF